MNSHLLINQNALEYYLNQVNYENRRAVKDSILQISQHIKTLIPKIGKLILNDGSESNLILLSGTIPITYERNQYNIPIELYIPERYPHIPPIVYVRPTPDMIVKPQHPYAYPDGLIHHPYIDNWKPGYHNLLELCKNLSITFSSMPPLFQRPPNSLPTYASTNTTQSSYYDRSSSTNSNKNTSIIQGTTKPNSVNKQDLINELTNKIQTKLQNQFYSLRTQIDKEFQVEIELQTSTSQIEEKIKQLLNYKANIENSIISIKQKYNEIDLWINSQLDNEIDNKINEDNKIDLLDLDIKLDNKLENKINKYIQSYDDISKQIIYLTSRIHVLEETIYILTKSISSSSITLTSIDINNYIKETRKLSREIFLNKMLLNKISITLHK